VRPSPGALQGLLFVRRVTMLLRAFPLKSNQTLVIKLREGIAKRPVQDRIKAFSTARVSAVRVTTRILRLVIAWPALQENTKTLRIKPSANLVVIHNLMLRRERARVRNVRRVEQGSMFQSIALRRKIAIVALAQQGRLPMQEPCRSRIVSTALRGNFQEAEKFAARAQSELTIPLRGCKSACFVRLTTGHRRAAHQ